MANFFGIDVESEPEARERLRQEQLALIQAAQRRSPFAALGTAMGGAFSQAQERWGSYVPPEVKIAQDTDSVMNISSASANERISKGEDPLKVQAEEFLKASVALRAVNPAASREFMQKFVETNQAINEQKAAADRRKAEDIRKAEEHVDCPPAEKEDSRRSGYPPVCP